MRCINASPEDLKEVERIMQNLRKNRNNYRKMHGRPMKRRRSLEKARNNRVRKSRLNIDFSLAFANFGISLKNASESINKLAQSIKEYEGDVFRR